MVPGVSGVQCLELQAALQAPYLFCAAVELARMALALN
jgi:hypothetical protein